MKLYDLFKAHHLTEALEAGLVKRTLHPLLPLGILNYTERAQFSKTWSHVTLNCRGLIYNLDTYEIIARPWPKFFNYGESAGGTFDQYDMQSKVEVTDKLDGSLGILYPTGYVNRVHGGRQYGIATRGSFTSDQAQHANSVWLENYHGVFQTPAGWTMLFEIIYPENRIVVDYKGMDDLVLLGCVHNESGAVMGPGWPAEWPGPRAEVMTAETLEKALSLPLRPGKEGVVVRFAYDERMVKIKQDDYVELHRIVTGLNERAVWERCTKLDVWSAEIGWAEEKLFDGIPDELHEWVRGVAVDLISQVVSKVWTVEEAWEETRGLECDNLQELDRREFAERVQMFRPWVKSCLFLKLDGKDYRPLLWKQVRPEGGKGPR